MKICNSIILKSSLESTTDHYENISKTDNIFTNHKDKEI